MTADGVAGELHSPPGRTGQAAAAALPVETILSICDRVVGEVGRRRHMFGWLRPEGAAPGTWLEVDAYYPRHRLVVVCGPDDAPFARMFREQVPRHGLRLLEVAPHDLGDGMEDAELALRRLIATLAPAPAATTQPAKTQPAKTQPVTTEPRPVKPEATSGTVARSEPSPAPRVRQRARSRRSAGELQTLGVMAGLALAVLVCAETYLAVADAALASGRVLLGLGIALDAASRALGTLAAARSGSADWAWGCAIFGAPAAAAFASVSLSEGESVDPAPLAGVLGGLAIVIVVAALVLGA